MCVCLWGRERERESHKPWLHVALCSTCALLPPLRILKSSLRRLSITASLEVRRWSKGRRCEVSTETTENGIVHHHHPVPFPTLPLTLLLSSGRCCASAAAESKFRWARSPVQQVPPLSGTLTGGCSPPPVKRHAINGPHRMWSLTRRSRRMAKPGLSAAVLLLLLGFLSASSVNAGEFYHRLMSDRCE